MFNKQPSCLWHGVEPACPGELLAQLRDGMAKAPDKPAVLHALGSTSYAELEAEARAVAAAIRAQGLAAGARIALLQPRDQHLVPTLVGILWAQCAYVPLDPSFPSERLKRTLEHAQPGLLLGPEHLTQPFRNIVPALNPAALPKDSEDVGLPDPSGDSGNAPASLIYTSGTTGNPKGVVVTRSALANLLCALRDVPGIDKQDRVLGLATIVFDIHTLELLAPLCAGATIVLADEATTADPAALLALIKTEKVTLVQATPSMWGLLIAAGLGELSDARTLRGVSGGERLAPAVAQRLRDQLAALWNMYGPTEATVYATAHRCSASEPLSIGKPLPGVSVGVMSLDTEPGSAPQLLAPGTIGELVIAGAGLASGYWRDQATTSAQFIELAVDGDLLRFYRTGDQAYVDEAGNLHCQGRLDQQVKVRGHRIELSEIEHELLAHDGLSESACAVHSYGPADDRLVAYYTNAEVAAAELRAHLAERLPSYMIPQQFVRLERLPRLASGKLDRPSLPRPLAAQAGPRGIEQLAEGSVGTAPGADAMVLGELWQELLGGSFPQPNDNFIDSGGHSLLAQQLIQQAAIERGKDLPVRMVVLENFAALVHHLQSQEVATTGSRGNWFQRALLWTRLRLTQRS